MNLKMNIKKYIIPPALAVLSFLVFSFLIKLPVWGAGLVAVGVYIGFDLIFSSRKKVALDFGGLSQKDYEEAMRDGMAKFQVIKDLYSSEKEPHIKEKISKIIDVVNRIFENFKKDPKDVKSAKSFLNYYLDTTINIIKKYRNLTSHGIQSQGISATLANVESLLDQISVAFEKQLENLLSDDVLDLNSELKVLEQALKMDGLDKK
ncbi:MAG: 5-bromo-4-chloroindolyl phosphate hydrolysis family protein [Spirochaetales bacterium]|nr:5-bromo-4-chloroindolyl phosphate hydrolysis family protein [Spirochaetales bacterium]